MVSSTSIQLNIFPPKPTETAYYHPSIYILYNFKRSRILIFQQYLSGTLIYFPNLYKIEALFTTPRKFCYYFSSVHNSAIVTKLHLIREKYYSSAEV